MSYTKLLFPMMLLVASGAVFAGSEEDANANMSFNEIDANGDGTISRAEAQNATGLADNFDSLDANADGTLDKSEVGIGGPDAGVEDRRPSVDGDSESGSEPAMEEESETETDY